MHTETWYNCQSSEVSRSLALCTYTKPARSSNVSPLRGPAPRAFLILLTAMFLIVASAATQVAPPQEMEQGRGTSVKEAPVRN
jgi:hypothetical protein